ncbi:hypothetical protein TVAG_112790 [Trichomonas vaginalis G3]|uniref:GOLD domain-containing protein n=1 Tax=Trichomonas vaginalis (strain ATCC PRA-98 / G3) TaxID=412133 RepID=A2F726_TRIV3|nr:hypothetical protein TVAG_112790 [Trichomonas vaginalis G3]|eukprot:XP_001312193.1 hypothetical protein [Trichomonas vaginalis G3]
MFEQSDQSSTLTIKNSYVDSNSTTGPGSVKFNNLTDNYKFNDFTHIYNDNCFCEPEKINPNWVKYFGNAPKIEKIQNRASIYDKTCSNNYYIFNCYFENCKAKGAIYIESDKEIVTFAEETVFNHCSSTSYGGSLHYGCTKEGQFVQQRTCYYKSISENEMAFIHFVKSSSSSKNYAIEVSVINCGENEGKGSGTLGIGSGDIHFDNNNITNNKCRLYSSIHIQLDGSSGTYNFSNFRENNQTGSISLYFHYLTRKQTHTVSYCNVIENKCGKDNEQVLFYILCTTNVDHCIFLNNIAKYMFQKYAEDSTLTISESYVESNSTKGSESVIFNNLRDNYDFNNNFSHFHTENCYLQPENQITFKITNHRSFNLKVHRRR